MMNKAIVIVAGGSGSRMKSNLPKQFITLYSKPILMHTIEKFYLFDTSIQIIVVLPEHQIDAWNSLCMQYQFNIEHTITTGGKTRFQSVKNGLSKLKKECLVGVHDGVRPLVSQETLKRCYSAASQFESAIPYTDSIESIRKIDEETSHAVNRSNYKMVQTPQVFLSSKLNKAYQQAYKNTFTDDASVFESTGNKIHLVEGNRENIKVTTPIDLIIREALFKNSAI